MDESLQRETEGLIQSWQQHDKDKLRDYLVSDVEDPRLNVQSILTRHFLVEALFGTRFAGLKVEELRFAAAMNWFLKFLKLHPEDESFRALHHAISLGADDAEGVAIPKFLSQTFTSLPATVEGMIVPNYISDVLQDFQLQTGKSVLSEPSETTFQVLWRASLANEPPQSVSVLEPACGSANDYRFLNAFGLARFLDYTGFDLCEKNIRNAK